MNSKKCPNCSFDNPETAKFCNECGTMLDLKDEAGGSPEESFVEEASPQQPFGERFRIIEELGQGSLGTSHRVFDKAMERELVLKSIKPEIVENKEAFEGFSREMKVERGLVHKNIARVFELNALPETSFITMEYIPGRDLKSILKEKKRLPVMEAIAIAKQIFNGLSEAHRHDAFHLDLRPDNIIIDTEGTAKIMDLGIARLFRSKGITRGVAGMPQYMSPEQVEGQEADAGSDIYAAGAILYEMLTGSLPPVGQAPRNPKEFDPAIPAELSLLVLKCLEKNKEKRYKTAKTVWAELEQMETSINQPDAEPPTPPPVEVPSAPTPIEEAPPATASAVPEIRPRPEPAKKRAQPWSGFPIAKKAMFPALIAVAVVIVVFFLWRIVFKPRGGPVPSPEPVRISLAVLPFEDLDPAKNKEYLGDGLAETLTRGLKKLPGLLLPDKESSFSFRSLDRESRIIGKRLQVDHYLDGTLEASEDKLRVVAKLVRTDSGAVVWSGQYEREQQDLMAITEEIGQAVAQAVGVAKPSGKPALLSTVQPATYEAFDAYAQGWHLVNKGGAANLEQALGFFDRAAAKEPGFGLAFEAQAEAYLRLAEGLYWPPSRAFPKAKDAALNALLIDPKLAGAQVALSRVKMLYEWNLAEAEKGFREALRLDPDCAPAHQSYATLLSALGRHKKAIDEIRAAQALNPQASAVNAQAGLIHFFSRLYEQTHVEINKAIATDPLFFGHHYHSALLQIQMGEYEDAILSLRKAEELGADPMEVRLLLAHIYARQGKRRDVGRILEEALRAAKDNQMHQVAIALVYAGLNEKDQAIACLEIASRNREPGLIFLKVNPLFDSVRGDPRFAALLQKIGLLS